MKRIGAIACLMIMTVTMFASAVFADNADSQSETADTAGFTIESSTPEDGATGVSVENLSVKIYFSKEMMPQSNKIKKSNAKQFTLTAADGTDIPVNVYYSETEQEDGLLMVVSDTINSDITISGDTEYTLTIGSDLQATDGTTLGTEETITFKTLNQSRSTTVYMIMMIVMIVGMVFFSSRSAKKAAEKEAASKGKHEKVNPYKEAKRTGKSVEEIVAKDQKQKAKEAEALAKKRAAQAELEAKEAEKEAAASHKRVAAPKPISSTGSSYKVKVVKTQKTQPQHKGTTNPKNQTGKQKNKKTTAATRATKIKGNR